MSYLKKRSKLNGRSRYHKAQYDTPTDLPLIDAGTSYGGFTRLDNMIVAPEGRVALASAVLSDNTGPPATAAEVQVRPTVFSTITSTVST